MFIHTYIFLKSNGDILTSKFQILQELKPLDHHLRLQYIVEKKWWKIKLITQRFIDNFISSHQFHLVLLLRRIYEPHFQFSNVYYTYRLTPSYVHTTLRDDIFNLWTHDCMTHIKCWSAFNKTLLYFCSSTRVIL